MDSLREILIIVAVASVLYPMRNLLGLIVRLSIYGMMGYVLFSGTIRAWDDKIFVLVMLALPILINLLFKYFKIKLLKT